MKTSPSTLYATSCWNYAKRKLAAVAYMQMRHPIGGIWDKLFENDQNSQLRWADDGGRNVD